MTDDELIDRCLRRDRTAQRLLFERYRRAMYTRALRMLADADLAHDVLQDAFVEAFRDLSTFRRASSLGAWLRTIVVRTALRYLRQRVRFESLDEASPDTAAPPWPDGLTGEDLDRAIRALPAGSRAVFLLVEVEGYPQAEAAALLQVTEGTVKSQLHYAKKLLRRRLADYASQP